MVELMTTYWQEITGWLTLLDIVITAIVLVWILNLKKESAAATAWCLTVILMPFIGALLFVIFGYQTVHVPLRRKRKHEFIYRSSERGKARSSGGGVSIAPEWEPIAKLAVALDGLPVIGGNRVVFDHEGEAAFARLFHAVAEAEHHIHIEFFIFHPDELGTRFLNLLVGKAKAGVQVRLLVDGLGSYSLKDRHLAELHAAGGKAARFLPLRNPLRRRVHLNLRNHRKMVVIDGKVGFCGGFNVGDEYLGKNPFFGPWRDSHFRIDGPATASLQHIFLEDWDFAAGESLHDPSFFPKQVPVGNIVAQFVESGPSRELKAIREVIFAAMVRARKRIWIASPYFVPDPGLLDALCLAGRSDVDVRLMCPFRPDKWIPFLAARYYWQEVLAAGVKVYQYTNGFLHLKMMMVDGTLGLIGSANLDNRSLHLNFETSCLFYQPEIVAEMEAAYLRDLSFSIRIDAKQFEQRPFISRMAENACRLLSPIL